jgi:hypothetical protein
MTASLATLGVAGYAAGALWVLEKNSRVIGFYEATGWPADAAIKDDVVAGVPLRNVQYRTT